MVSRRTLVILIFVLSANVFLAQQQTSVSLGPIIGWANGKNAEATINYAGAVRLNLGGIGIEGSVGYQTTKYNSETDGSEITTKTYPIMLTGQFNLISIVYAQAGIGWYNSKIDFKDLRSNVTNDATKNKVGYHIGFGGQADLGTVILTGDIKYVFLDLDFNSVVGSLTGLKDTKSNYSLISVGLLFKL